MTAGAGGVELDMAALERGVRQLASGIDDGARRAAMTQAEQTAARLRANVPVRTGRLRDSIAAVDDGAGAGVTYGAGVSYARPVAARSGAVGDALDGCDQTFYDAAYGVARSEVGRL